MPDPRPGGRAKRYAIDELIRLFKEAGLDPSAARKLAYQYSAKLGVGQGRNINEAAARELAKSVAAMTKSKVGPLLESLGASPAEPLKASSLLATTPEPTRSEMKTPLLREFPPTPKGMPPKPSGPIPAFMQETPKDLPMLSESEWARAEPPPPSKPSAPFAPEHRFDALKKSKSAPFSEKMDLPLLEERHYGQPASKPSISSAVAGVKPPAQLNVEDIPAAMAEETTKASSPKALSGKGPFWKSSRFQAGKNIAKGVGKGAALGLATEFAPAAIAGILGAAERYGATDDAGEAGKAAVEGFAKSRQELGEAREFSEEQARKEQEQTPPVLRALEFGRKVLNPTQFLGEQLVPSPEDLRNYGSALEGALRQGKPKFIKSAKQMKDEETEGRFPEGLGEGLEPRERPRFQSKRLTTEVVPQMRESGVFDIDRFMRATERRESSGGKKTLGVDTGKGRGEARGNWQVLPGNITAWAKEYGFGDVTPEQFHGDVDLQRKIVKARMQKYAAEAAQKYPDNLDMQVREVARQWYGPSVDMESTKTYNYPGQKFVGPSMKDYTLGVLRNYTNDKQMSSAPMAEPPAEMSSPDFPMSREDEDKIRDVIAKQVEVPKEPVGPEAPGPWRLTGETSDVRSRRPGSLTTYYYPENAAVPKKEVKPPVGPNLEDQFISALADVSSSRYPSGLPPRRPLLKPQLDNPSLSKNFHLDQDPAKLWFRRGR